MAVEVRVNGSLIRRMLIQNITGRTTGVNTYRWTYADMSGPTVLALMSAQQGEVEHVYEDGAMVLISKVAEAAAASETVAS